MYNYEEQSENDFIDLYLHSDTPENKEMNILDTDLELFLQEIEISIKMFPGEVWGIYESININRYVFNQYITATQIVNEIQTYIGNNCVHANKFSWYVNAEFVSIENKKLLYITVSIDKSSETDLNEKVFAKFLLGSDK